MEDNFGDILKKEFDKEDKEIRRKIAEREDVDAGFAALQADESMKQEFRQMLSERSGAGSEDGKLLAQMSEEGREAYHLGLELLKKRAHREQNHAAEAGNPEGSETTASEDPSVETAEGFTGEAVNKRVMRFPVKKPYVAAVLVVVFTLGLGITSFSGKTYVMDLINHMLQGKGQTTLNSKEEARQYSDRKLDEVYTQVNQELGINMVELFYLPKDFNFKEVDIDSDADRAYLSYTDDKEGWIQYFMYANQADQSVSVYHDDEMLSQEQMILSDTLIDITKYKNAEDRVYYEAVFVYKGVNYRLTSNTGWAEFKKIVKNLFFY